MANNDARTVLFLGMPAHLPARIRHAHDVTEHMGGDGRENRASAKEEEGGEDSEEGRVG